MSETVDVSDIVFTPSRTREATLEHINFLRSGTTGLDIGIQKIDEYLVPLRKGELMVVMARPGMGKSSLISHYANRASRPEKRLDGTYPIVVTAEMAVEDYQLRQLSTKTGIPTAAMRKGITSNDWDAVESAARAMPDESPIIYIGHSLKRTGTRPAMTIENVMRAIETLYSRHKVSPSLVCIDYLQRMKLDKTTRDRRMDMSEIVEKCKDLAIAYSVPVILGSQVGRSVEERMPPIPALHDGKETGNIEETPDVVLGLFRPISIFSEGEIIPKTSPGLVCTRKLFHLTVLKQRGGESGRSFWLNFDMATSELADVELARVNFNEE